MSEENTTQTTQPFQVGAVVEMVPETITVGGAILLKETFGKQRVSAIDHLPKTGWWCQFAVTGTCAIPANQLKKV
jgi:hypothetical protein